MVRTFSYALDRFAPNKTLRIPYINIIREHRMSPALLKSSMTGEKMLKKVNPRIAKHILILLNIEIYITN